ncbi:hypothetical protein [Rhodococcus sp. BH5]|uniref:hypothetical protein n=1 Tax=Rhodococcus sp. BH5 TaxID=2871702 RepID=UPI0022CDA840|nr:hypothetical protein [Rhodococcus sp. BH5]MCZ9635358.1 hypothetical protein [Rhodococcus sp. BH5]
MALFFSACCVILLASIAFRFSPTSVYYAATDGTVGDLGAENGLNSGITSLFTLDVEYAEHAEELQFGVSDFGWGSLADIRSNAKRVGTGESVSFMVWIKVE